MFYSAALKPNLVDQNQEKELDLCQLLSVHTSVRLIHLNFNVVFLKQSDLQVLIRTMFEGSCSVQHESDGPGSRPMTSC